MIFAYRNYSKILLFIIGDLRTLKNHKSIVMISRALSDIQNTHQVLLLLPPHMLLVCYKPKYVILFIFFYLSIYYTPMHICMQNFIFVLAFFVLKSKYYCRVTGSVESCWNMQSVYGDITVLPLIPRNNLLLQ